VDALIYSQATGFAALNPALDSQQEGETEQDWIARIGFQPGNLEDETIVVHLASEDATHGHSALVKLDLVSCGFWIAVDSQAELVALLATIACLGSGLDLARNIRRGLARTRRQEA
jgi:hypothetical protein